ncbi:MAG TPA: hypothetical protein PKG52_01945 [bacterium]|nr:hypothetical protein [bacterium]HPS29056.1 hypothetical protein [bacterium]
MKSFIKFNVIAILLLFLAVSCETSTDLVVPPEDSVNRVTDFYIFKDGKTFMYLSSNLNRKYDFGNLVLMEIDDDGDPVFLSSKIVPSLTGKMAVSADEDMVYVTTRDYNGIVRLKISGKSGSYRLSYIDDTNGFIPSVLKTKKEPYALAFNSDGTRLLVTHLLNGEVSAFDLENWEGMVTEDTSSGITDITFDPNSGYYLASHKTSGTITAIEVDESLSGMNVGTIEIDLDIPTEGIDIRSIEASTDGESVYAAFRNNTDDTDIDSAPQLLKFRLTGSKYKTGEILETIPLNGTLGELTVFPYTTGSEDNEYKGELVFVALSSEGKVAIVDSGKNEVIDEIEIDDCEPYQVQSRAFDNLTGMLLVSCFIQDKVVIYNIDLSQESFYKVLGVIE